MRLPGTQVAVKNQINIFFLCLLCVLSTSQADYSGEMSKCFSRHYSLITAQNSNFVYFLPKIKNDFQFQEQTFIFCKFVHFQSVFFPSTSCIFVFTIATIFARDTRQQYPFMHKCNSTLYYIHFEITGYPYNLIGSQQCDLFPNRTIFCSKSHLFLSQ